MSWWNACAYDVFGQPTIRDVNGTALSASAVANPYLFTGPRYDAEAGLYHYRARYYDFATARFLQPDPLGYTDGLNLYTYVGNNPLGRLDPYGLSWKWCSYGKNVLRGIAGGALGGIVAGAISGALAGSGALGAGAIPGALLGAIIGGAQAGLFAGAAAGAISVAIIDPLYAAGHGENLAPSQAWLIGGAGGFPAGATASLTVTGASTGAIALGTAVAGGVSSGTSGYISSGGDLRVTGFSAALGFGAGYGGAFLGASETGISMLEASLMSVDMELIGYNVGTFAEEWDE